MTSTRTRGLQSLFLFGQSALVTVQVGVIPRQRLQQRLLRVVHQRFDCLHLYGMKRADDLHESAE